MIGQTRYRLAPYDEVPTLTQNNGTIPLSQMTGKNEYSPAEVAIALSFVVGVIEVRLFVPMSSRESLLLAQLLLGVLHLGFVTTFMSDQVVAGFTTAAAVHVFTSQLNKVIGVKLPRPSGFGQVFKVHIMRLKRIDGDLLFRHGSLSRKRFQTRIYGR